MLMTCSVFYIIRYRVFVHQKFVFLHFQDKYLLTIFRPKSFGTCHPHTPPPAVPVETRITSPLRTVAAMRRGWRMQFAAFPFRSSVPNEGMPSEGTTADANNTKCHLPDRSVDDGASSTDSSVSRNSQLKQKQARRRQIRHDCDCDTDNEGRKKRKWKEKRRRKHRH